jgi:hypothetical protein
MKHAITAMAALTCVCLAAACATGGAGAKGEKAPQYANVQIWEITRAETAYPDGMLSGIVTRAFDERGNLVKEETYSGTKALVSRKTYTTGDDGAISIVTYSDTNEILGKATQTTKDGLVVSESQTNPKGEFEASEEYAYDDKGNKTRWTVKTASGNTMVTEYAYELGRPSTITVKDGTGAVVKKFVKVYPEQKVLASNASAAAGKTRAKDDAKAKAAAAKAALEAAKAAADAKPEAEEEYDGSGALVSRTLLTWDGKFLTREEKKNAFGATLSSTTYKNDANGNPVEIAYADRNGRTIEIKRQQWVSFTHQVVVR